LSDKTSETSSIDTLITSLSSDANDYGDYLNEELSENELDHETYEQLLIGKQINQALEVTNDMVASVNYGFEVFKGF
jgi:hypothetical protein